MVNPDAFKLKHPEYHQGYLAGVEETKASDFDKDAAVQSFKVDPPDTDFQRGYYLAVGSA